MLVVTYNIQCTRLLPCCRSISIPWLERTAAYIIKWGVVKQISWDNLQTTKNHWCTRVSPIYRQNPLEQLAARQNNILELQIHECPWCLSQPAANHHDDPPMTSTASTAGRRWRSDSSARSIWRGLRRAGTWGAIVELAHAWRLKTSGETWDPGGKRTRKTSFLRK